MNRRTSIIALTLPALLAATTTFALNEADFFTDTSGNVSTTKWLNPGASTSALQSAIDTCASKSKGGKIILRKGNYSFGKITMKSKVHIFVKAGSVITPTKNSMFDIGMKGTTTVKDVSFRVYWFTGNRRNSVSFLVG